MCSNIWAATENSCNIYYLQSGLCKAGMLDNAMKYTKPAGSSSNLVAVRVLSTSKSETLGTNIKPGKNKVVFSNISFSLLT